MNPLDEPIEIVAFNKSWGAIFRSAANELRSQLGSRALEIQHIGSTAVDGLRGKPVVDIMVGVAESDLDEEMLHRRLVGYQSFGEAGVPGRLYFRRREHAATNVHVVTYAGKLWRDNILLRDYLRAHSEEAVRYARAKDQIVEAGTHTLLAYSAAKHEIIQDLLAHAQAWKP